MSGNTPTKPEKKKKRIFGLLSLTTLLVLVAAAIVIPNLLRSRGGCERTPRSETGTLVIAQIQYQFVYGHYAMDISSLAVPAGDCVKPTMTHACLIDKRMADSSRDNPLSGYYFVVQAGPTNDTFLVAGIPVLPAHNSYCSVDDGIIHVDVTGSNSNVTNYAGCKGLPSDSQY